MVERDAITDRVGRIAQSLAAVTLLVSAGACGGVTHAPKEAANKSAIENSALVNAASPPSIPAPLPVLDRSRLLAAAAAAADAVAASRPLPEANAELIGRPFEIRLPFGCNGPMLDGAADWAGWTHNEATGALKLSAQGGISETLPWLRGLTGEQPFETVEGFWIERPWTSSERCPLVSTHPAAAAPDSAPSRQTLGIAQFFAPDAPRTLQRRSRPYSITLKAANLVAGERREYRLVLNGRVVGFADKQPVHCSAESRYLAPICVIAVEFTRVAFEDPASGTILSEWLR